MPARPPASQPLFHNDLLTHCLHAQSINPTHSFVSSPITAALTHSSTTSETATQGQRTPSRHCLRDALPNAPAPGPALQRQRLPLERRGQPQPGCADAGDDRDGGLHNQPVPGQDAGSERPGAVKVAGGRYSGCWRSEGGGCSSLRCDRPSREPAAGRGGCCCCRRHRRFSPAAKGSGQCILLGSRCWLRVNCRAWVLQQPGCCRSRSVPASRGSIKAYGHAWSNPDTTSAAKQLKGQAVWF